METNLQNFVLHTPPNGVVRVDVFLQDETLWLTQKAMAALFDVTKSTISEHLRNIYNTNELQELATVRKFRTVQKEGTKEVNREIEYYNLEAMNSNY
jgi:hypothetical protein